MHASKYTMKTQQTKVLTATALTFIVALALVILDEELSALRGGYIQSLRQTSGRGLSLYLGNGKCQWKEPMAVVPTEIDLYKTLLVGFPSG